MMDAMTWQNLAQWAAPAIILSVAAYFIRFFGKAISDQTPYADNRDWEIELSGVFFFVEFLFPPIIIASAILLYFKDPVMAWFGQISGAFAPLTYHWVNLVVVFVIWTYYASASRVLTKWKYKIPDGHREPAESDRRKKTFSLVANTNAVLLQPSAMLLFFIFGVEISSGSMLWTTIFAVQLFTALIGLALNYSLMRTRFPIINIHFSNGKPSLQNTILLKANPDTFRVRDDERVLIIDKSVVSEIEFVDAEQKSNENRPILPFTLWIPWLLALYSFWKNNLDLGIIAGIVIPLISVIVALMLANNRKEVREAVPKFDNAEGFIKLIESLPLSTKIASLGTVINLVSSIFGAIGAWHHNVGQLIILGIIVPFITWALWQIVGMTSITETTKAAAEGEKPRQTFSEAVFPMMQENEAFLKKSATSVFAESIELVNDAIDYAHKLSEKDPDKKLNTERAFYFYVHHVLMPTSYSISINLTVGNLPSCFKDMRILVEFLAKSYLADSRYKDAGFFKDKLQALHEEKINGKTKKREIDFIKDFDASTNFNGRVIKQWQKFSNEIHARQYTERIVGNVTENDHFPSYALAFPAPYQEKDVPELNELGKDIEEFAAILKSALGRYIESIG